jgi:hypothetical protein
LNAQKKSWVNKNKERVNQYMERWRNENKEREEEYRKIYIANNREKVLKGKRVCEKKRRESADYDMDAYRKMARDRYHRTKVLKGRTLKTEEEKREIAKNYMDYWRTKNAARVKEYSDAYGRGKGALVKQAWRRKNKHIIYARNALHRALRLSGRQKADRTETLLGYTYEQLKQRIEFNFKDGMSWENYGEWHIDHIKPVSRFVRQGVIDPMMINALCNLRPLWAADNLRKNKYFNGNSIT